MNKETIKEQTVQNMEALGIYKEQYDRMIDVYAELIHQYLTLNKQFAESGYQCQVGTDSGGAKKAPIVATLENLRRDILAYSDRLCLNPKAIETVTTQQKGKSMLAEVLGGMK
ncbi:P27 family phage terminase small subunit [Shouchella lonarensis]|uniref:Phage terminase, small subunit n=1 Tax=Shouchella lonarensis TaxID=1464122 RepID=A0A1G6IH18_9BACI|nr:P27 family phage terminase small subunit [Shouchella lonarensis]SDC05852.1 Phage terminase, small subunit [Shouchella lonarensis]